MKCEICGKKEAGLALKRVEDGVVKEISVCAECAARIEMDMQSPMSITDFLFGADAEGTLDYANDDKSCPVCSMKMSDFRRTSQLGCSTCYEVFETELASLLVAINSESRHVGKVPESKRITAEVMTLRKALNRAVAGQCYEEAAQLRDKIKELTDKQDMD